MYLCLIRGAGIAKLGKGKGKQYWADRMAVNPHLCAPPMSIYKGKQYWADRGAAAQFTSKDKTRQYNGEEEPTAQEEHRFKRWLVKNKNAQRIALEFGLDLRKAILYCSWTDSMGHCTMDNAPGVDTIAAVIDVKGDEAWVLWQGYGITHISSVSLDTVPYKCVALWYKANPDDGYVHMPHKAMYIDLTADDGVAVKVE
jgi:hypothetical protein